MRFPYIYRPSSLYGLLSLCSLLIEPSLRTTRKGAASRRGSGPFVFNWLLPCFDAR